MAGKLQDYDVREATVSQAARDLWADYGKFTLVDVRQRVLRQTGQALLLTAVRAIVIRHLNLCRVGPYYYKLDREA